MKVRVSVNCPKVICHRQDLFAADPERRAHGEKIDESHLRRRMNKEANPQAAISNALSNSRQTQPSRAPVPRRHGQRESRPGSLPSPSRDATSVLQGEPGITEFDARKRARRATIGTKLNAIRPSSISSRSKMMAPPPIRQVSKIMRRKPVSTQWRSPSISRMPRVMRSPEWMRSCHEKLSC